MPTKKYIFFVSLLIIVTLSLLVLPKIYAQNSNAVLSDYAKDVANGEKTAESDQTAKDHQYMIKQNETVQGLEENEVRSVDENSAE